MAMSVVRSLSLGAVLLTAAVSVAHAQGAPKAAQDGAPVPPELTVAPITPKRVPEPGAPGGGKPANICQELVAFLELGPQGASQGPAAGRGTSAGGPGAQGPPVVDQPQHKSGITAPVPPPDSAQRPPFVTLEQARAFLDGNDLANCQRAAQQMRRAGVPMPDGLIALAALRPDLHKAASDGR